MSGVTQGFTPTAAVMCLSSSCQVHFAAHTPFGHSYRGAISFIKALPKDIGWVTLQDAPWRKNDNSLNMLRHEHLVVVADLKLCCRTKYDITLLSPRNCKPQVPMQSVPPVTAAHATRSMQNQGLTLRACIHHSPKSSPFICQLV